MLRFAAFETLSGLNCSHASRSLAETGERVVVGFGAEHASLEQRPVKLALSDAGTLRPSTTTPNARIRVTASRADGPLKPSCLSTSTVKKVKKVKKVACAP